MLFVVLLYLIIKSAYLRSLDAKFQADEDKRASEVQRLAAKNSSDRPAFRVAAVRRHVHLVY